MTPKVLLDLLMQGGAKVQDIADHVLIVEMLLSHTSDTNQILVLIEKLDLKEYPRLKEFVTLLASADMLNENSKNALLRECQNHDDSVIIEIADPEIVKNIEADTILASSSVGLTVRQGQKIYKRSLQGDINKLLD